jgi:hypothetical protein
MNKSRTDLDRLFEKGISDVAREPRKSLSEEDIAAAAAASKSGAGVFLRSHTKEILLGAIFFAVGCLVMIALLRFYAPKSSEPQADATIITEDTVALSTETPVTAVETFHETSPRNEGLSTPSSVKSLSNVTNQTSHVTSQTSNVSHPASDAPTTNSQPLTPNSPEPVVIKKTIVQRDTVVINETVIIKDTTYVP